MLLERGASYLINAGPSANREMAIRGRRSASTTGRRRCDCSGSRTRSTRRNAEILGRGPAAESGESAGDWEIGGEARGIGNRGSGLARDRGRAFRAASVGKQTGSGGCRELRWARWGRSRA